MLLKSEICLVLVVFVWNFDLSDGQACGSALTGRGKIVSEGHPNSYPSFFDCDWTIEAGPYDTVHIMFEDFNIEPGEACEFDYLEISAMGSSKKFCGDKISDVGDNGRLSLRGPVSLKMASDDSVNLRGFSLFYRVVPGDSPAPTTPPVPTTTTPAMTTTTTPVVTCDDDPCQNEGECTMVGEAEYYCFCKDGFEGNDCEINIDDCVSNPCENGGTCIDGVQSWSCQCVEGFIGENCGIDYDECRANPCKNGATCEDRVNAFTCHCSTGWTGWDCATDIDDCTPNPCMNYGVCEDHLGFHTCICHPRYTGENCTILIEITTTTTTPVPTTTPHLQTTTPSLPAPPTTIASQPRSEPTEPSTDDLNNSEEEKPNEPGFENRPEGPTTQPNSVFPDVTTAADDLTSPSPESLLDSESNPGLSDDSFRPTNAPLTNNTGTTSSTGNYINATEMPGNSTTTVQNSYNTTISGEEQENAEEKDGIASYVIAAVVVVTTLGSIASSILYYYKSSIKSRKIQPSDSDSSTQGT